MTCADLMTSLKGPSLSLCRACSSPIILSSSSISVCGCNIPFPCATYLKIPQPNTSVTYFLSFHKFSQNQTDTTKFKNRKGKENKVIRWRIVKARTWREERRARYDERKACPLRAPSCLEFDRAYDSP